MSRGRPRGSVKPDRRLRRDYRFSPTTLRIIEQGRELTEMTETAFVEAAIQHYLDFLIASELERLPLRFPGVTGERVAAQVEQAAPAALVEVSPVSSSSSRKPTYQIYMRHEPGSCPDLPEGFDYIDRDRSVRNRRCMNPIHRIFARPCPVAAARKQAEHLQKVASIVRIWIEDGKGQPLRRDSWRKENGRWIRDD